MQSDLEKALYKFAEENGFLKEKGPLSVAIIITNQVAKKKGLPLDPNSLLSPRGGQVKGLSGKKLKEILADHGIERVLAREAGRTSRGSIDNMKQYVNFLNERNEKGRLNLEEVEKFWIARVKDYFASQPFVIKIDQTHSLTFVIKDLLNQARERQKEYSGTQILGAVMQHLVGAKLELIIPHSSIDHHSISTADQQLGRPGDFYVGDSAIHVTSSPTEALIEKCRKNLDAGFFPIIITLSEKKSAAKVLAENKNIENRVEVFSIETFLASNIYEQGQFMFRDRKNIIEDLVYVYNNLINKIETDPGLKIAF